MSYFNPNYYNIQNLTEADRSEVDFWRRTVRTAAESIIEVQTPGQTDLLEQIRAQVSEQAILEFLDAFDCSVCDIIVSMLDQYGDEYEVPERLEIKSGGGLQEWDERQGEES